MKARLFIFVLSLLALIGMGVAFCEGMDDTFRIVCDEGWSWDTNAYNTFSGELDLPELTGEEISVRISTDLPYSSEETDSQPVFTTVNGKRITVLKQSDTISLTPDGTDPILRFTGKLRLPSKRHISRIIFHFEMLDHQGKPLRTGDALIIAAQDDLSGAFYIPVEIGTLTLYLSLAAAVIWILTLLRYVMIRKQQINGGINRYADLQQPDP